MCAMKVIFLLFLFCNGEYRGAEDGFVPLQMLIPGSQTFKGPVFNKAVLIGEINNNNQQYTPVI